MDEHIVDTSDAAPTMLHALAHGEPVPARPDGDPGWDVVGTVAEALAEGVLVFDRSGRVVLSNTAAERILRLSRHDLMGVSYDDPKLASGTSPPTRWPAAWSRRWWPWRRGWGCGPWPKGSNGRNSGTGS